MAKPLNLRHLLAALQVSRCGSISEAARSIHLSQSAVTQALSKLENTLAATLFRRTTTGVITTEVGQIFLNRTSRGLQSLKAIESLISSSKNSANRRVHRLLTTTQLRALIAVVETGSYTGAALQLQLTQPTVHRAIRELETLCRERFFQRSPRGVETSWKTRQMALYANLFFAEIAQGIDEINEFKGVMNGRVSIGALPLSRTHLVPHAVTRLLQEYPEAQIRIIDGPYEEQLNALLRGEIDVIVGALRYPSPSEDVVQELLFDDPLNIVVKPDHWLSGHHSVSPAQLRDLNWIAPKANTPAREVFVDFFRRRQMEPPEHVIECSSMVAIRGLLLESERAALLSARQVIVDVQAGLLAISPITLEGTNRQIGLTLRKAWLPTKIQEYFLSLLRNPSQKEFQ